jgi:prepilin-type N-terminal cleavage/methylation domain-containing protein
MNNKKGFTLIEILAVIVILGVITSVATISIVTIIDKTKLEAFKQNVYALFDAYQAYVYDKGVTNLSGNDSVIEATSDKLALNAKFTNGTIFTNSDSTDGTLGLDQVDVVTDGTYCASGTKDNLTIVKGDCKLLDFTPPTLEILAPTVTSSTIKVTIKAEDKESGISAVYYSLIEKSTGKVVKTSSKMSSYSYTFSGLTSSTAYNIKVKVVNGNYTATAAQNSVEATQSATTNGLGSIAFSACVPSTTGDKCTVTVTYTDVSGETTTNSYNQTVNGTFVGDKTATSPQAVDFASSDTSSNIQLIAKMTDTNGNVISKTMAIIIPTFTATIMARYQSATGAYGDYQQVSQSTVKIGSSATWQYDGTSEYNAVTASCPITNADNTCNVDVTRKTYNLDYNCTILSTSKGSDCPNVSLLVNGSTVLSSVRDFNQPVLAGATYSLTYNGNSAFTMGGITSGTMPTSDTAVTPTYTFAGYSNSSCGGWLSYTTIEGGTYRITVKGAQGGGSPYSSSNNNGYSNSGSIYIAAGTSVSFYIGCNGGNNRNVNHCSVPSSCSYDSSADGGLGGAGYHSGSTGSSAPENSACWGAGGGGGSTYAGVGSASIEAQGGNGQLGGTARSDGYCTGYARTPGYGGGSNTQTGFSNVSTSQVGGSAYFQITQ